MNDEKYNLPKITVLVVEPLKPCRVRELPDTLDAMREIVGGDIEAVYPFQEPVAVVCNAEGKMLGLPYNRPLLDGSGLPVDILCGTFFIAGVGAEDFISLTDEQIQKYKSLYDNVVVLAVEAPAPQEQSPAHKNKNGKKKGRAER